MKSWEIVNLSPQAYAMRRHQKMVHEKGLPKENEKELTNEEYVESSGGQENVQISLQEEF